MTTAPSAPAAPTAPTVEELEAQERQLVLPHFTYDDAWRLGGLLVDAARAAEAPVAIDIRRGPQQLFHSALPGSTADNDAWIDRKRRVVERYGESSLLVGSRFRAKGSAFEESSRLDPDQYAAHGGSFPLAGIACVVETRTVSLPRNAAACCSSIYSWDDVPQWLAARGLVDRNVAAFAAPFGQ